MWAARVTFNDLSNGSMISPFPISPAPFFFGCRLCLYINKPPYLSWSWWGAVDSAFSSIDLQGGPKNQVYFGSPTYNDQLGTTTVLCQAHELSDSIFNHMFRYESAVQARRRALMLVDVLVVPWMYDFDLFSWWLFYFSPLGNRYQIRIWGICLTFYHGKLPCFTTIWGTFVFQQP